MPLCLTKLLGNFAAFTCAAYGIYVALVHIIEFTTVSGVITFMIGLSELWIFRYGLSTKTRQLSLFVALALF